MEFDWIAVNFRLADNKRADKIPIRHMTAKFATYFGSLLKIYGGNASFPFIRVGNGFPSKTWTKM